MLAGSAVRAVAMIKKILNVNSVSRQDYSINCKLLKRNFLQDGEVYVEGRKDVTIPKKFH